MKIRTLAPKEVQKYIEQNETFKDLETIVVERVVIRHGNRKQTSKITFSTRCPKVPSLGRSK